MILRFQIHDHLMYLYAVLISVWGEHVYSKIPEWRKYHIMWLTHFPGPLYPLMYDNLKYDLSNELQRVFKFLNMTISKTNLDCTVKDREGLFRRQKKPVIGENGEILTLNDLYTKEMRGNITAAASQVVDLLQAKFGIEWTVRFPYDK